MGESRRGPASGVDLLSRVGDGVRIDIAREADIPDYKVAVSASAERMRPWNPVNPDDLAHHVRSQSALHRTFLVRALDPVGAHDLVGKVNVTNIVRGRAWSATLGYDAYDPYAGTGLFARGLCLVVDVAFAAVPRGLGLHRVEASVQPGNTRSAGLLRRLGFRPRGDWPGYLWLEDAAGTPEWRDHHTYGVIREQWPAPAYAPVTPARPVLVLTVPEPGDVHAAQPVAAALAAARELGVGVVRDDGTATTQVALTDAVAGAVLLSARGTADLLTLLRTAGASTPVVAHASSIRGAPDVVRLALSARAGAGVGDGGPPA